MQDMGDTNSLVARAANRHLGKSDREAAGVLSAAQRHTHFLDSPRMSAVLGRSDFRFVDLKHRNVSVFLVLPPDRLSTYSRWLRLLVTQSLTDMARDPARPQTPVLYFLDEFAALGHLGPVERAMVSWPATVSNSGRSCRTSTSSALHTARGPEPSSPMRRAAGVRRQRS
jgi:type IV secretion system protein VirD4